MNEDHSNLVKFSEGDANYRGVVDFIQEFCDVVIAARDQISSSSHRGLVIDPPDQRKNPSDEESKLLNKLLRMLDTGYDNSRLLQVKDPYSKTFEWALENTDLGYEPWLSVGQGLFHVTGKPGSGKSTLMRYLYFHPRTQEILKTVAT